jgi:hypothetical protein
MSTRFYDTDLTERGLGLGCAGSARGAAGRATSHHGPS